MKRHCFNLFVGLVALTGFNAAALTRYVDLNSPSPTPPYTSWAVAATNIQDAIDAADAGDLVLVTNGVYSSGGRVVHGAVTNRVALISRITVQSVNGPTSTMILGDGGGFVRCAYLTNDASLVGFTLTNGVVANGGDAALENAGGGIWGESTNAYASDCIIVGNSANYLGGGAYCCTVSNCVLLNNFAAYNGGGAHGVTLHASTLANNFAGLGGGADASTLFNCILTNNSGSSGGAASYSALSNCFMISNHTSSRGGAVFQSTLQACKLFNNSSLESGGGARLSTLSNCLLVGNVSGNGGGAKDCTLNSCTIVSNTASGVGGAAACILNNSIIISNFGGAFPNYDLTGRFGNNVNYCFTTPLPQAGVGNLVTFSGFVDYAQGDFRLPASSPCINAGNNTLVPGDNDLAGTPRIVGGTVDIGAYEFQSPASVLAYAWAQQNGLPTDGSADFSDADGDGANNWQEWRADTIPTNAVSALRLVSATNSQGGAVVTWQSVATRNYWLERATNLGVASPFQTIATNIVGAASTKTYTDPTATGDGPYVYRIGVQ